MKQPLTLIIAILFVAFLTMPSRAVAQLDLNLDVDTDITGAVDPDDTDTIVTDKDTNDSDTSGDVPDDFTGTLADSSEDPDSFIASPDEVFGEDKETDDTEDSGGITHIAKGEIDLNIVYTDVPTGTQYLETNYSLTFTHEVDISTTKTNSYDIDEIQYIIDIVGDLASNELFTCKLDIKFKEDIKALLKLKHMIAEETETEAAKSELAITFDLDDKTLAESHTSNCMAFADSSEFVTVGDDEWFLRDAEKESLPNLANSILIDDFDPNEVTTVESIIDFVLEDLLDEFYITGTISIEFEPFI